MKVKYKVGDRVKVAGSCDNENYESFKGDTLEITKVSTSVHDHLGFDSAIGEPLYDFKNINFSLYQYEIVKA